MRDVDETGVSGTGVVAIGVRWPNGKCAMSWQTEHTSVAIYDDDDAVRAIHGHDGRTRIVWVDPTKPNRSADFDGEPVDFAGEPIRAGDLVIPLRLMEVELLVVDISMRNGHWWVSALGWPECGYGLGDERATALRVVGRSERDES